MKLYAAGASIDDEEEIMWLSALFESPPHLRAVVQHPDLTHGEETVRFIRCVGRELWVFWVPDVTEQLAAAITATCEPIRKWSTEAFIAAVARTLPGARVTRLQ
jgi:hypothetical protein